MLQDFPAKIPSDLALGVPKRSVSNCDLSRELGPCTLHRNPGQCRPKVRGRFAFPGVKAACLQNETAPEKLFRTIRKTV